MKSIFYKLAYSAGKIYWFMFRPKTMGVKCLIRYQDKVLLIRNSYGKMQWTFPGGGVKRGESHENAARREILEEVGIRIQKINYLGEYKNTRQYKRDTVHCYSCEASNSGFLIDGNEVIEANWFPMDNLPNPQSPAIAEVIKLYLGRI